MTSVEGCGLILSSGAAERAEVPSAIAVEALVGTYSTLLFRVAHAVLRNPAEAEDAVQEVFVRVLAHREKLPGIADMRVWLVRIAWRLALDRKRRITPEQMDEAFVRSLVSPHLPADRALDEARELRRVLMEMDRLPSAERYVLTLCAMEEMRHDEIARVLGKSESAVRALLFRARKRLRDRLGKETRR